jgi:hypothetical protein
MAIKNKKWQEFCCGKGTSNMLLLSQSIARIGDREQAKVYNILQHDCLVLLIMLQDLESLWEKNEVSSNKMLPNSKETTLLCFSL